MLSRYGGHLPLWRCLSMVLGCCLLLVAAYEVVNARPKVALVLGGGSSRGLSHIGLLRAFEEEGIPVDYVIGTSMGSVVAGLYAAGFSADNLQYMVRHTDFAELFVPSIPPAGGLIDSERFAVFLDVLTNEVDFAELPIPFYTVVINLVTGQEMTLHEGRLSQGILASMSVPGMFPPVRIGDDYFIDGGLRNLAPVSVARALSADVVVAVDVRRSVENINHDTITSNLQLTLGLVLAQATDAELALADIVITPQVDSGSYMDYERIEHFVAEGYWAAKQAVPELRAALLAHAADLTFEPRRTGLAEAEFAERMRLAVQAYERRLGQAAWGVQLALKLDADGLETDYGVTVPLGRTLFGTYTGRAQAGRSTPTLGLGLGRCNRTCATVFARQLGADSAWHAGAGLQGRLASTLRYSTEWVSGRALNGATPGGTPAGPAWRVRLVLPAVTDIEANEWRFGVQQDAPGAFGPPDDVIRGELLFRHHFPAARSDILEAVRASTAWYIGLGAQTDLGGANGWNPIAEVGIAFEARLFGLYPLNSRLSLTHGAGAAVPWSLRWTLGND